VIDCRVRHVAGRLVLLCGLPGSGKTTLATRLAGSLPAVRLCPDDWLRGLGIDLFDEPARARLEAVLSAHAHELLRHGVHVVLEFGFWSRAERDEQRLAARALGAPVELRYLDVPFEVLVRRLAARNLTGTTVTITPDMLREYSTMFDPPTAEELALFDTSR
jgi:predicted kinase